MKDAEVPKETKVSEEREDAGVSDDSSDRKQDFFLEYFGKTKNPIFFQKC